MEQERLVEMLNAYVLSYNGARTPDGRDKIRQDLRSKLNEKRIRIVNVGPFAEFDEETEIGNVGFSFQNERIVQVRLESDLERIGYRQFKRLEYTPGSISLIAIADKMDEEEGRKENLGVSAAGLVKVPVEVYFEAD